MRIGASRPSLRLAVSWSPTDRSCDHHCDRRPEARYPAVISTKNRWEKEGRATRSFWCEDRRCGHRVDQRRCGAASRHGVSLLYLSLLDLDVHGSVPGAHGITGNNLFFRDREIARYYTEYHLDAIRAQLEKNFFSNDINPHIKTLHEYVERAGGQSVVVHNMVTRGSRALKPDFDTLWSYQRNESHAVDENSLWEAVHTLDTLQKSAGPAASQLPSVFTIYFSGLDHMEHLSGDAASEVEEARLVYVDHLDKLLAKFFAGHPAITRNHFELSTSEPVRTDPIEWPGLMQTPAWQHTVVVLASDHGHAPIRWGDAIGLEDLKVIFGELSEDTGRAYHLEEPALVNETMMSKIRAVWGLADEGQVSGQSNVVATLNGGTLGIHLKPREGGWTQRPDFVQDVKPVLEPLLLTLHTNGYGPEAVLYLTDNRYVLVPYTVTKTSVQLLPLREVTDSPLNAAPFPMAVQRLNGLASTMPGDPASAPDLILLADRSRQFTYANKQEWRVIEGLKKDQHRHFHSDHGHLAAAESVVPLVFMRGGDPGLHPHATICQASLVDITPTILDVLGSLPMFEKAMAGHPDGLRGHSLKQQLTLSMEGVTAGENLCAPAIP